jgi:multidrug efflux pump subunit AcrB
VRGAINGVIREAVIAAALTGLMILLFLASWPSTLIIAISIPLSILSSVIVLGLIHETINIMTLGGLALAVGILVDDATVTIENIEGHFENGADQYEGIFQGAAQIAAPAFVSTLCICIVCLPMFFLSGVARYLFAPLGDIFYIDVSACGQARIFHSRIPYCLPSGLRSDSVSWSRLFPGFRQRPVHFACAREDRNPY